MTARQSSRPESGEEAVDKGKYGDPAVQTLHMADRLRLDKSLLSSTETVKVSQLQIQDLSRDCPLHVRVTARWGPSS